MLQRGPPDLPAFLPPLFVQFFRDAFPWFEVLQLKQARSFAGHVLYFFGILCDLPKGIFA